MPVTLQPLVAIRAYSAARQPSQLHQQRHSWLHTTSINDTWNAPPPSLPHTSIPPPPLPSSLHCKEDPEPANFSGVVLCHKAPKYGRPPHFGLPHCSWPPTTLLHNLQQPAHLQQAPPPSLLASRSFVPQKFAHPLKPRPPHHKETNLLSRGVRLCQSPLPTKTVPVTQGVERQSQAVRRAPVSNPCDTPPPLSLKHAALNFTPQLYTSDPPPPACTWRSGTGAHRRGLSAQ